MYVLTTIVREWIRPLWTIIRTGNPSQLQSLNLIKTIYWNFKLLSFKKAIYFPIFIYRRVKIYNFGNVILDCDQISPGMIKIGHYNFKSYGPEKIYNRGELKFHGNVYIGGGGAIENNGIIEFMGDNVIPEGGIVLISKRLFLGKNARLGFLNLIQDSDDHYIIDVNTLEVKDNKKDIIIGDNCWLGAKTCVKKGTILPEGTIIASANTLLNKDYSEIPPYSILGGIPAKIIGYNKRRIVNWETQKLLDAYFNEKHEQIYKFGERENLDTICRLNEK